MRYLTIVLLFLCTLAFSQIPEFDTKGTFPDIIDLLGDVGTMCFVKWDNDDLADVLAITGGMRVTFYKNIGTKTDPKFKMIGDLIKDNGWPISFSHGWCGGSISPRAGDLNNDGITDFIIGTRGDDEHNTNVNVYYGTQDDLKVKFGFGLLINRDRPACELVDFNGDGLLDIVVSSHTKIMKEINSKNFVKSTVLIFYNKGTKESPKFSNIYDDSLYIDGNLFKQSFCNFLFTDLNNDHKKDAIFFKSNKPLEATFHYSLNVSTNDSIILGPINDILYNGIPLFSDSLRWAFLDKNEKYNLKWEDAFGNRCGIAYYDTDNDGSKEFYFNTRNGYHKYSIQNAVPISSEINKENNNLTHIQYSNKRFLFNIATENTAISIIDLKGRIVKSMLFNNIGENEISLKNLSNGHYFLHLRNSKQNEIISFVKVE